jgi:integrase
MRNPHNLAQSRHNVYYIRFPIPASFHPTGKRTDLKMSLGTRCPRTALHVSHALMYLGQRIINMAAHCMMTYDEIRAVLKDYFTEALVKRKALFAEQGRLSATKRSDLLRTIQWADEAVASGDFTFAPDVSSFIALKQLDIKAGTPEYDMIQKEYAIVTRDYFKAVINHDLSYETYDLEPHVVSSISQNKSKFSNKTINDEYENYIAFATKAGGLKPKTVREARTHFKFVIEFLGVDASLDMSSEVANSVRHMLMNVPKYSRSRANLKKIPFDQLIALANDDPLKKNNLLSNASINKYFSNFNGLMNWAVSMKYAQENPFKGFILDADADQIIRNPFSEDEVERIMVEVLKEPQTEYRWGALIARYTGARPEEIAQLHAADVQQIKGIWCFKFNDDADDKNIKTKAGNRIVPIHPELIRLGLLDYQATVIEQKRVRLLYQLPHSAHNGYSRKLGRWFNESILPRLQIKKKGVVFYCMRHTAATEMLQADVPLETIRALIGHEQEGVTMNVYAKVYKPQQLLDAVKMIKVI